MVAAFWLEIADDHREDGGLRQALCLPLGFYS
jgi:hypothetical protein